MCLYDHPVEFIHFTNLMYDKIKASRVKHQNDSLEYTNVKNHFVDEILECFNLTGTQAKVVKEILMSKCIDQKELIDVANLAFAMTITNLNNPNHRYSEGV
jgi:hypothetical protein